MGSSVTSAVDRASKTGKILQTVVRLSAIFAVSQAFFFAVPFIGPGSHGDLTVPLAVLAAVLVGAGLCVWWGRRALTTGRFDHRWVLAFALVLGVGALAGGVWTTVTQIGTMEFLGGYMVTFTSAYALYASTRRRLAEDAAPPSERDTRRLETSRRWLVVVFAVASAGYAVAMFWVDRDFLSESGGESVQLAAIVATVVAAVLVAGAVLTTRSFPAPKVPLLIGLVLATAAFVVLSVLLLDRLSQHRLIPVETPGAFGVASGAALALWFGRLAERDRRTQPRRAA